jgi:hypothetical protein
MPHHLIAFIQALVTYSAICEWHGTLPSSSKQNVRSVQRCIGPLHMKLYHWETNHTVQSDKLSALEYIPHGERFHLTVVDFKEMNVLYHAQIFVY